MIVASTLIALSRNILKEDVLMNRGRVFRRGALLFTLLVSILAQQVSTAPVSQIANRSFKTKRPFRMLVLGDSIVWGQGLTDEHKFSYMLGQWICAKRNNGSCPDKDDVQIHVEAHSGALIARPEKDSQKKEEDRFTRKVSPVRYPGEVNHDYPTVWGQVELAQRYYLDNSIPVEQVDLILLNGGINDMGAPRILAPKLLGFIAGNINDFAKKYCEDEMKLLLDKVANTFPNARIVVPGYFPLVSLDSPESLLTETIGYLFLGQKEKANGKNAIAGEPSNPPNDIAVVKKPSKFLVHMANRSRDWTVSSNAALAAAVSSFNSSHAGLPLMGTESRSPLPGASARALFVPVLFADENAYAAQNAFLWKLVRKSPDVLLECAETNHFKNLIANDELQSKRGCMCEQAGKKDDLICLRAGAFHPNVQGAELYFKSITKALARILPLTWSTPK
jgi:lysophospholipase L1-like esterase